MFIKHKIVVTSEFLNKAGIRYAKCVELMPEDSEELHLRLLKALYQGSVETQNAKFDIDGTPVHE